MDKLKTFTTVTLSIIIALAIIGVIGLAEKRPPSIYVFKGASPFNTGFIGTSYLVSLIRSRYPDTSIINSITKLPEIFSRGETCVYVVISPEIEYTSKDIDIILNALKKCRTTSILIADEYITSNKLLEVLNSSIRITGIPIINTHADFPTPYVPAFIFIPEINRNYTLLLDIASNLSIVENGNSRAVGFVGSKVVAAYEHMKNINGIVFVLGDGSIFLNQALRSNITKYRFFALDLIKYLCNNKPSCRIVIDGSRYAGKPIEEVFMKFQSNASIYTDTLFLGTSFIARILHPSTWLQSLIKLINSMFNSIKQNYIVSLALVFILAILIYYFLKREIQAIKEDNRLEEQKEIESYITGSIREAIVRGKIKLTKNDFITLFTIVNNVTKILYGMDLCSDGLINVVPRVENVNRYVMDMCKLYRKATKGGFTPVVISWNRTTFKMLRRSEEFLKLVGQSISAEKGVEYLFMSRLSG